MENRILENLRLTWDEITKANNNNHATITQLSDYDQSLIRTIGGQMNSILDAQILKVIATPAQQAEDIRKRIAKKISLHRGFVGDWSERKLGIANQIIALLSEGEEPPMLTILEWLDVIGCDHAYKKDMKETYEHTKPELQAQIDKMKLWYAAREAKVKNELYARYRQQIGETWYWQGDGEDHLESTTCPILIEAQDLRDLVKQARAEVAKEIKEELEAYLVETSFASLVLATSWQNFWEAHYIQ